MKKNINKTNALQRRIRLLLFTLIGIMLCGSIVNAQTFVAKPATCVSADKTAEVGIMTSILDGEGKTGNATDGQGPGYFYWLRKDNPATFYINMNSSSKISAMKFYYPWGADEDAKNITIRFYNGASLLGTENLVLPNNYPNKYLIPLSQAYLNVTKVQFVVVDDWLGSTVSPNPRTSLEEIVFGDLVCNAGTTAPPIKDITNICPSASLNLNNAHTGAIPSGTSLVWYTNNTHTGTALSGTQVTQVTSNGTYYAFYYDSVNNCYSPSSSAVNVTINNTDSDGDSVLNMCDLDNDNDGILDSVECGATDKISNGTFPTSGGNTNTLTGWTVGGTYPASGAWVSPTGRINLNSNGLEFRRDFSSVTTVSQNLVQVMPGAKINLNNIYWIKTQVNASNVKFLFEISYAGVVYATIDSTYGDTPIITAKNGASVNINTLPTITAIPTLPAGIMSSKTNLIITLPYNAIASNGNLLLTFTAGSSLNQVRDLGMQSMTLYSCKDTDNDGIPDYLDLDSDGDGCSDAIEGAGNFTSSQLTTASGSLSTQNPNINFGTTVDANGVPTAVGAFGQAIGESQDNTKNDCIDTDRDGYPDWQDLDDDNDGILDVNENLGSCSKELLIPFFIENFGASYLASSLPDNILNFAFEDGTNSGLASGDSRINDGEYSIRDPQLLIPGTGTDGDGTWWNNTDPDHTAGDINGRLLIVNAKDVGKVFYQKTINNIQIGKQYEFKAYIKNGRKTDATNPVNLTLNISDGGTIATLNSGNINVADGWKEISVRYVATSTSATLSIVNNVPDNKSGNDLYIDDISLNVVACDDDGDGIPNQLDLDSDGDGCPDAIEGAGNFTSSQLTSASGTLNTQSPNQNFGVVVDANGIPTIVGATGQTIGESLDNSKNDCIDSDSDGYPNWQDLDDDNDGILDTEECSTINNNPVYHLYDSDNNLTTNTLWLYKQTNGVGSNFVCTYVDCSTAPNGTLYKNTNISGTVTCLAYDDGKYYTIDTSGNLLSTDNITIKDFINLGNAQEGSGYKNLGYDNGVFYHYWINSSSELILYKSTDPVNSGWTLMGTIMNRPYSYTNGGYTYELKDIAVNDNVFYFYYYNSINVSDTTLRTRVFSSINPTSSTAVWTDLGTTNYGTNVYNIAIGSEDIKTVCDTDGDGIPNYLDLDSDNDGCPDGIEGGASFTNSNLINSSMPGGNSSAISGTYNKPIIQNLGKTVGNTATTIGVPTIAGTGQTTGDSQNSSINNQCNFPCYKPAQTTGTTLDTNHGITSLGRAGADNSNWPMVRKGAWTVLEAKTKGFVVNRLTDAQISAISAAQLVEGMMVYNITQDCLQINVDGTATGWKCFNNQTCPD